MHELILWAYLCKKERDIKPIKAKQMKTTSHLLQV